MAQMTHRKREAQATASDNLTNGAQTRGSQISQSQLLLRSRLWPDLDPKLLWSRKERKGFTTIPRALPLILTIIDSMSKGKPLSSTYFELWCRAHDESFVTLNRKEEQAFHAGFTGQRAVSLWKERIRGLAKLGFIKLAEGPSGELSYTLILNPYKVIKRHHESRTSGLTPAAFNALNQRAIEIRANDLDE